MLPVLFKHGVICWWVCLPPSSLFSMGNPVPSQFLVTLGMLLNWPPQMLRSVRVHIVGSVTVRVSPVCMVYLVVSTPPALKMGIDPTCCISYVLFRHTHVHVRGLPFGILLASWAGKWRVFLIQPVISIYGFTKFSPWCHESHRCLLLFIFIICLCRI